MGGPLRLACTCLLAGALGAAWAQSPSVSGIFTCVDGKGRRYTSDRPIPECADREQRELNASGTVRRVLAPVPTASERAVIEERERKATEERQRQAEQKRIEKLLVARYPNQQVHDGDRAKALQAVQEAMNSGQKRIVELREERKKAEQEAEFHKHKTREQWPPQLKRQFEDNDQQLAAQQRFIAAQQEERQRIAARFDEELVRLKRLWAQGQTASTEAQPVQR
jgi:hypothetical protein